MDRIRRYERHGGGSIPSRGANNRNNMLYNIWSEGYRVTGNEGKAHYIDSSYGASFQEACDKFFSKFSKKELNERFGGYSSESLSVWGCKLFDNETDARKSFG